MITTSKDKMLYIILVTAWAITLFNKNKNKEMGVFQLPRKLLGFELLSHFFAKM